MPLLKATSESRQNCVGYVSNNSLPTSELPSAERGPYGACRYCKGASTGAPSCSPFLRSRSGTPSRPTTSCGFSTTERSSSRSSATSARPTIDTRAVPRQVGPATLDYPMVAPNYAKARSELREDNGSRPTAGGSQAAVISEKVTAPVRKKRARRKRPERFADDEPLGRKGSSSPIVSSSSHELRQSPSVSLFRK